MGRWIVRKARAIQDAILGKVLPNATENPPERILIIRPYYLGDILLCLPVAQAIKRRWPHARIAWLLREEWTDLIHHHSMVDEAIPFSQKRMHSIRAPAEFFRVARELRKRSFDLVLNLSWDRSSALWAWASGAAVRIGIEEYGRPRLTSLLHTSTVVAPERSTDRRHMADFYYEPLRPLGFERRTDLPQIFPTDDEQRKVDARLASALGIQHVQELHPPPSILHPSFILVHPGARLQYREWPVERFVELIGELSKKTSHVIVLVCGPGEEPWASQLAEKAFTTLFWPAPSLGELMALTRRAVLFIGNESGPMHLAAAAGCRVVAIFGTDPARWGPLGSGHRVVADEKGLEQISVEKVLTVVLNGLINQ